MSDYLLMMIPGLLVLAAAIDQRRKSREKYVAFLERQVELLEGRIERLLNRQAPQEQYGEDQEARG